MKIIKQISKDIEKEIDRVECYAKRALEYKENYPNAAEHYYKVALQGINDIINNLHMAVVELIDAYKKEKGEAPEAMKIVYSIIHEQYIEHLSTAKSILSLYKEI